MGPARNRRPKVGSAKPIKFLAANTNTHRHFFVDHCLVLCDYEL